MASIAYDDSGNRLAFEEPGITTVDSTADVTGVRLMNPMRARRPRVVSLRPRVVSLFATTIPSSVVEAIPAGTISYDEV